MARRPRSEAAVEWLLRQVQDGAWPLNSRIPTEAELAETLGIGRSTVREATKTLVNNGMLECVPGRGTFVRSRNAINAVLRDYLGTQPVVHVIGLRRALEADAAGLAATRRTDADLDRLRAAATPPRDGTALEAPGSFHAAVFRAAGNPLLTEVFESVIAVLWRGALAPGPAAERAADHLAILDAIERRDVPAARAAAAAHADRDFLLPDEPA